MSLKQRSSSLTFQWKLQWWKWMLGIKRGEYVRRGVDISVTIKKITFCYSPWKINDINTPEVDSMVLDNALTRLNYILLIRSDTNIHEQIIYKTIDLKNSQVQLEWPVKNILSCW